MESIGTSSRVAPIAPSPLDFARGRNRRSNAVAAVATTAATTFALIAQAVGSSKSPIYIAVQSARISR